MGFGEKLLSIDIPAENIVPAIMIAFQESGISALQTFNLQSACAPLDAPCPHHGTTPCSCQLVILMTVDCEGQNRGLIIHGNEGVSEIALIDHDPEWRLIAKETILRGMRVLREINEDISETHGER